jgi:hypothetical protein
MVLHLAECLDVPLRERNQLLLAAGFAPVFGERALDESEMAPVREALERFLSAHEPYPRKFSPQPSAKPSPNVVAVRRRLSRGGGAP